MYEAKTTFLIEKMMWFTFYSCAENKKAESRPDSDYI